MPDELQTAATAHRALADAFRAKAEGDEETALRLLNGLDVAATAHAAAYLFSCVCEGVEINVKRDPRRIELAYRSRAEATEQDLITHQVRLMTRDT